MFVNELLWCLLLPANWDFQAHLQSYVVTRHRFQGAWASVFVASGSLGAVFVNFVVRLFRSRLDAVARCSQVSHGDVSHELFVYKSKRAF